MYVLLKKKIAYAQYDTYIAMFKSAKRVCVR